MKYSVKLILWPHDPNKLNQYPIYLRITVARKTKYISTGHYIDQSKWDAKNELVKPSHPEAGLINAAITDKKSKALFQIVNKSMVGETVTSGQVKRSFNSASSTNYFSFVDQYREEMDKKRKGGTTENYRKHALKLQLYHGSRDLTFDEITPEYLAGFERYLFTEPKRSGNGATVGVNYANVVIRSIRTMFNAARKRGLTKNYPFTVYELPKYTPPDKEALTLKELEILEDVADNSQNHRRRQAATYFLLGAYTGLRISDWYQFDIDKHVSGDQILIRATKNNEWVGFSINKRIKRTLERIRKEKLTIYEQDINEELKAILADRGIKKRVTSHTGRHTFAVTMCAEMGISCETCATLMGITFETCAENYYRVTKEKIRAETARAWG